MAKSYTISNNFYLRYKLFSKFGSAFEGVDFLWVNNNEENRYDIMITFMCNGKPVKLTEAEDQFPSDQLIAKLRLLYDGV